jgi:PKD domain
MKKSLLILTFASIIFFQAICCLAASVPLQNVTVNLETVGTQQRLNFSVTDPILGVRSGNSGIINYVIHQSNKGVVAWIREVRDINNSLYNYLGYAVYDPMRGEWKISGSNQPISSSFGLDSGTVIWLASNSSGNSFFVKSAVYDPELGIWTGGFGSNTSNNAFVDATGAVIWTHTYIEFPNRTFSNCNILVYDPAPSRKTFVQGTTPNVAGVETCTLSNGTLHASISNTNLGYNAATGIFQSGNTIPKAYFVPTRTSGLIPLQVLFWDLSIGTSGYDWSFGDGTSSSISNPSHIYSSVSGSPYTVTETVTGPGGSSTFSRQITPSVPTFSPIGFLDGVTQNTRNAFGWSLDKDNSSASNRVHLYIDGPAGTGTFLGEVIANLPRPDVNTSTGYSGNHGFSYRIPSQYFNGVQHTIYAYGIDLVGGNPNTLLTNSPKTFTFSQLPTNFDFDGDKKADVSIFRPTLGQWWINQSSSGQTNAATFGISTDKIVPADYTGDGKTDIAFWRPSTGAWFVLRSEDSTFYSFPFGTTGDIPISGDYDGDGKSDSAIFRPSDTNWYINKSSGGTTIQQFGANGDAPVTGDFDGDYKSDIAVFRSSTSVWWIYRSSDSTTSATAFGNGTDKPVPADYTGDGKTDIANYRPATGEWFFLRSENSTFYSIPFGTTGDMPAPADYDGDGKADPSIFRPSETNWYINKSSGGTTIQQFGANGDKPVANAYVP